MKSRARIAMIKSALALFEIKELDEAELLDTIRTLTGNAAPAPLPAEDAGEGAPDAGPVRPSRPPAKREYVVGTKAKALNLVPVDAPLDIDNPDPAMLGVLAAALADYRKGTIGPEDMMERAQRYEREIRQERQSAIHKAARGPDLCVVCGDAADRDIGGQHSCAEHADQLRGAAPVIEDMDLPARARRTHRTKKAAA